MTVNWKQKENRWQRFLNNESLKRKIYDVIFESDTPAGKTFDVALMLFIVFSILLVVIESMQSIPAVLQPYLQVLEYMFTFSFCFQFTVMGHFFYCIIKTLNCPQK